MLKPMQASYQGKTETFYCHHWRVFPPVSAMMDIGVEEQRSKGLISTGGYESHKIWERVCGLDKGMNPEVCLDCPHARKLVSVGRNKPPHLESLDGEHSFPIVDAVDITSQGHSRANFLACAQGQNRPRTKSNRTKNIR